MTLLVGNQEFHTTADTLTRNAKDSYFSALLRVEGAKTTEHFIPRDPGAFKYVLEFLTYGSLLSQVEDVGVLKKLVIDAEHYYMLPKLAKQARLQLGPEGSHPNFAKFCGAKAVSAGNTFVWNTVEANEECVSLDSSNTVLNVNKSGVFQLNLRYLCQCATNGSYVEVLVDNSPVARCYHNTNDGYQQSRSIQEIIHLGKGSFLKVLYNSNYNLVNDPLANTLSLLYLGGPGSTHSLGNRILKLRSSKATANGHCIVWNQAENLPKELFSYNNTAVTVLKGGQYQVTVHYVAVSSQNSGKIELLVNGSPVATTYHGQNDGYQQSRELSDVFALSKNSKLQVKYHSNSASHSDALATSFVIRLL
eukprot:CAMPEP_0174254456 /NCGR_PEP_ID=MMETSP0439-20130205/3769_1 /TAXON_ID=0 /ORGANISM="Stereomyxa ramosa, Strain Chinc5" /LENGTH=362 /DNA_ID=CAMNT_0015336047 /DNA_START=181 /DNA_END=1269 /DNA_ORIENTATION=-